MGKSVELLGLAAFNVVIALILSATFLTTAEKSVNKLTEANVESFLTEVTEVSGGMREDMDSYSVTEYFMKHLAEDSKFVSRIEYALDNEDLNSERTLEMDKLNFISHVLQGMESINKHETAVEIEYIEIADNGRRARVTTTNYERGIMPVADAFGEAQMMPVTGTSYCEQELVLNKKNIIQMAQANCNTNIDILDAF